MTPEMKQLEQEAEGYYKGLSMILSTPKAVKEAYIAGATSSSTVKNLEREVERLKEVIKELYYCPAIKNAMKVFSMNIDDEYNQFKTENNL